MIFQAIYFFLPAAIANMMPIFVKKLKFLNYPVDFNKTWKGKRILGDHKTYRGFFFGIIAAFLFFEIQRILYNYDILRSFALIDYSTAPIFLGALLGFSALLGDSVKSFFKRRFAIRPGKPWVPFDQLDYIIFALALTLPWSRLSFLDSILLMIIGFLVTVLFQYTGYMLKLKDDRL